MSQKTWVFISLAILLCPAVFAIDTDGFDAWPFCFPVDNGSFDLHGETVEYGAFRIWGPTSAVFANGLDLGKTSKYQI